MNNTKHTPGPWKVEGETCIYAVSDGIHLASMWTRHVSDMREAGESWIEMRDRTQPLRDAAKTEEKANAAFIIRACNAHYSWANWIAKRGNDLPDHACAECVPNSEMIVSGFQCVYHEARAALAAAEVQP